MSSLDSSIFELIEKELQRQKFKLELIASENFVSKDVLAAQGSVLTNKYAEGYPEKRYYGGCEFVDQIETLAIERAKKLFNCQYANVQPHSGSQANQSVFLALLKPGDTILSMSLQSGGHLSHGSSVNLSGKWFKVIEYNVNPKNYLIDYNVIENLAYKHKPQLIIAGYSAYTRNLNFEKFRNIADKVGAYLMADIAHIAGLIVTGHHVSPIPYADVVTSTTHKTLRGPRGGIVLTDNLDIGKKINSAIFPGLQGGPLMHVIAAKAVAFYEALNPEFYSYINQVILNAKALADILYKNGYNVLTGGTENHMVLIDLRNKNITGKQAQSDLEGLGIACNKNSVPFDTTSPFITSGIRLGSPACTTRGMKEEEFKLIGNLIIDSIEGKKLYDVKNNVIELCQRFMIY